MRIVPFNASNERTGESGTLTQPTSTRGPDSMQTSEIHYIRTLSGLVLSEAECSSFRFARHYHLDHHIGLVTDGIFRQCLQGLSCTQQARLDTYRPICLRFELENGASLSLNFPGERHRREGV